MSSLTLDDEIATLVRRCRGFDPSVATGAELDEVAAGAARISSWADALRARVGAARRRLEEGTSDRPAPHPSGGAPVRRRAARPRPSGPGGGSAAEARRRADAAEGARRCPSFTDALADGQVSTDHLAAVGRVRNAADVATYEPELLAAARARSADEFAVWLRAWDDERDAAHGADLAARRRVKRRVTFHVDDDGLPVTRAVLGPVEHRLVAQALYDTAEALWRAGDRTSSLPQRLADALVELITRAAGVDAVDAADAVDPADAGAGGAPSTELVRTPRRPASATVVAVLEQAWLQAEADRIGVATTLDGVPLTPTELRILLCEANVLPVVLGGDGRILDFGRARRLATDAQWRALLGRDGGCVVAGCTAPAGWCVVHHCRPWEDQGGTDLTNLCLLCPTHHRALHHQRWTATVHGGAVHLTTSAGYEVAARNRHGPVPARAAPDEPLEAAA